MTAGAHEDALEFIRHNGRAVLATRRRDGSPQLSPVLAVVDAQSRVVISTRETAIKTVNLRRNPHASVCVMSERFFGEWHTVDGSVEIVSLPEAIERGGSKHAVAQRAQPDHSHAAADGQFGHSSIFASSTSIAGISSRIGYTRWHWTHFRPLLSGFRSRSALHRGQTRISSKCFVNAEIGLIVL